jgi:hypothetical protein
LLYLAAPSIEVGSWQLMHQIFVNCSIEIYAVAVGSQLPTATSLPLMQWR